MTEGKIQIKIYRLQKTEDIEEILQVQKECNLSVWSADDYLKEAHQNSSRILTAKIDGKTRGFIVARKSTAEENSEVDILNFGVSPGYQKQGVGNALWNELAQDFFDPKTKAVWLEVRESNINAVRFYKNRGFCEVQRRKKFYTQPSENALLMKLEIQFNAAAI